MTAVTLSQSSPFHQSSPCNQRVPSSPGLSPFYGKLAPRRTQSPTNSPAALVPEVGEKVFTGSPLLRQILKVGRKRQLDQEGSPSPSIASVSKRFCESSRVPTTSNSVIVVRRKVNQKTTNQEQVVPSYNSPVCAEDSDVVDIKRKLPENREGVKPLDLFTGDEIFACHEE